MRRVILSFAAAVVAVGCGQRDVAPQGEGLTSSAPREAAARDDQEAEVAPQGEGATGFAPPVITFQDTAPAVLGTSMLGLLGSPLGQGPLLAASALASEAPEPAESAGKRLATRSGLPGQARIAQHADHSHLQGRPRMAHSTPKKKIKRRRRPPPR
jgi:hypothetical protein